MPTADELAAIAAAGSRGREAYQNAQATLAAQQQAAMQAALRGNFAASASPEAQAQLANTVAQGYRPQQAALASNQAASEDWFARTGEASKQFIDKANAIVPVIEAQLAAQLGGGSGGGGGGGRSGGSGSSSGGADDWMKNLKAAYGTTSQGNIQSALLAEAHANRDKSVPLILQARQIGVDKYGIPEGIVGNYVKMGGSLDTYMNTVADARTKGVGYRHVAQIIRNNAKSAPGNQKAAVTYALAEARRVLPQKTAKKKRRG